MEASSGFGARRFLRFEDGDLQSRLLEELEASDAEWTTAADGSVVFEPRASPEVMRAVHRVRDGCFHWYGLRCSDPGRAARFRRLLEDDGLSFVVEHADSGIWFIVPRVDEALHEELLAKA